MKTISLTIDDAVYAQTEEILMNEETPRKKELSTILTNKLWNTILE